MVNFGLLAAEIVSLVWGTPANFKGFLVLAALLHGNLVVGVSQTAAFNRGRHLYSAGRPSGWALAHISSLILSISYHIDAFSVSDVGLSFPQLLDRGGCAPWRLLIGEAGEGGALRGALVSRDRRAADLAAIRVSMPSCRRISASRALLSFHRTSTRDAPIV